MTKNVTPMQMAAELARIGAAIPMARRQALEEASEIVINQIKIEVGEYQTGAGPFAAWAPLAESTLADKVSKGFPTPSPELRTGELRDSYGKTFVSANEVQVGSNYDVAVWQELGTSKMPPRSILGLAGAKKEREIWEHTGRLFYGVLMSQYQARGFASWTGSGTNIEVGNTHLGIHEKASLQR